MLEPAFIALLEQFSESKLARCVQLNNLKECFTVTSRHFFLFPTLPPTTSGDFSSSFIVVRSMVNFIALIRVLEELFESEWAFPIGRGWRVGLW